MNPRTISFLAFFVVLLVVAAFVAFSAGYTLDETEQAIVLQFGEPVGGPVSEPGLHWKMPFIQEVRRFDKRLQAWDGDPNQIPTRGREFISIDTTARWRIVDPLKFLQSVTDTTGAQSRLDDVIDSVVRDKISGSDLVEIVRSADWEVTERELAQVEVPVGDDAEALTREVQKGREQLTHEILREASLRMPAYGIELVDVRIKRLNYIADVRQQVFTRMISERERIAMQYRSEGEGDASRIKGETSRDLAQIRSEAKRQAEVIRGQADAQATAIYNAAFGRAPEFYRFFRTLESYGKTLGQDAVLVIGADSQYFSHLKQTDLPSTASGPAGPSATGAP